MILLFLAVLAFSAFVKIATTLTVFRYGVGLQGLEFGVVTLVISLVIAWSTLPSPLSSLEPRILQGDRLTATETEALLQTLTPYLEKRIDEKVLAAFAKSSRAQAGASVAGQVRTEVMQVQLPAYLISEVKGALTLGVTLLIPFVLLDLLVAHFLTLLGIQQLAIATVALPLKIAVFLSVNGWELLIGKMLS